MVKIISSADAPHYLPELRGWFKQEWGENEHVDNEVDAFPLPKPLLALQQNNLMGGLAFTSFVKPKHSDFGLWINALLVTPQHRGQGIASRLIQAADAKAQEAGVGEFYTYTDIPALYQKQGWTIVSSKDDGTVLRKTVPPRQT